MRLAKLLLTLEALFAGLYLSLTRGLFIVYLAAAGFDVNIISQIVFISTGLAAITSIILYKFPEFMVARVKLKLLTVHAAERLFWIIMVLYPNPNLIMISYSGVSIAAVLTGSFLNFVIYDTFDESGVRDVTAKRNIAFNVTSVLGLAIAMVSAAVLAGIEKYFILFSVGIAVGLLSTASLSFMNLQHLEYREIPSGVENPEKVMSTSLFLIFLLVYGNLLGIFWIPYLVQVLDAPEFMGIGIVLVTTVSNIVASVIWAKRSYNDFRIALVLTSITPVSAMLIPIPVIHLAISSINGIMYTGANFLGNFLLAKYSRWFGAIRSGIILSMLGNMAQFLASLFGITLGNEFLMLFTSTLVIIVLSNALALLTIPEVALVSEDAARTYSYTIYNSSLMGYSLAMETAKDTVILMLKLIGISIALLTMYISYRFVLFLIYHIGLFSLMA